MAKMRIAADLTAVRGAGGTGFRSPVVVSARGVGSCHLTRRRCPRASRRSMSGLAAATGVDDRLERLGIFLGDQQRAGVDVRRSHAVLRLEVEVDH